MAETKDTEYTSIIFFILNIYNHYLIILLFFKIIYIVFGFLLLLVFLFLIYSIYQQKYYFIFKYLFLIWISTEVRIIAFVLFFYLILILLFFQIIKNFNSEKVSLLEISFLCFLNLFTLSLHPFAIIFIFSQLFFLFLIYFDKRDHNKKKIILYFFLIILFCVFYGLLNQEYILSRIDGEPMSHNKLSFKFFIGYNFKSFFNSYLLGFINLSLIILSVWSLRKNIFKNLFLLYLILVFLITYVFIISISLTLTGVTGARYWTYLVPIVIMINFYNLFNIKKKLISSSIISLLILFNSYICLKDFNHPLIRKPDTPGLIKFINNSEIKNIVSQNLSYFDVYLRNGYKKDLKKEIFYNDDIINFDNDFLYICLDLIWIPKKNTYSKEIYDCYPKSVNTERFKK